MNRCRIFIVLFWILTGCASSTKDSPLHQDSLPSTKSSPTRLDASELEKVIESVLNSDLGVHIDELRVQESEGIIQLTGLADSLLSKGRALSLTQSIWGVRSVVNQIEIQPTALPDTELRNSIETAFLYNPILNPSQIQVAVEAQWATLSGKVTSYAQKELANQTAQGIRGLQGVRNEIQILPSRKKSDPDLQQEIQTRFQYHAAIHAPHIKISVTQAVAHLNGRVQSIDEKEQMTRLAWIEGIRQVDASKLEITPTYSEEPRNRLASSEEHSDSKVRAAIEDALFYDPRVRGFKINVHVQKGVVTLAGSVENLNAKTAADEDAQATLGVTRVRNNLLIKNFDRSADKRISEKIRESLSWDPYLSGKEISVTTSGGTVTLSGEINSYLEKERAEEIVSKISGVTFIENKLSFAIPADSDREISERIEKLLSWNIHLRTTNIRSSVKKGIVILEGKASSRLQSSLATESAYRAGAKGVVNQIDVAF